MGKWAGIIEWNKQRKKGLKNPTILWIASFALTFALTILPSALINAIDAQNPSLLANKEAWIKVIVDNLYPMIITQSVVTMLQNNSIATPSKKEKESKQFVLGISWTHRLTVCLIFYILLYLIFVYANPSWRNLVLYVTSGILAAVGLGSVLQISNEQERVQKAIEAEKQAAQFKEKTQAIRVLAWNSPPVGQFNVGTPSTKAEEEFAIGAKR